jgi:hypothetical protein
VRLVLTQLMPLIHAIPPVRGRRGWPRRRPDTLYVDRGDDHDRYRRQACEVGITPLTARRGEEHGSGLGVYRCRLIFHMSGLNSPLRCMMGAPGNEVAFVVWFAVWPGCAGLSLSCVGPLGVDTAQGLEKLRGGSEG